MTKFKIVYLQILLVTAMVISSCTNIKQLAITANTTGNPAVSSSTSYTHVLKTVAVVAQSSAYELDLSVDSSLSNFLPLTQFCNTSDAAHACLCQLTWNETSSGQTITRTKKLPLTAAQSGLVKCSLDSTFWGTITSNTVFQMTIIADTTNATGINVQPVGYKTGTSNTSTSGDFMDSTLNPFKNIFHYSCYGKRSLSYEVLNQTLSPPTSGTTALPNAVVASRFCSSSTTSTGCTTTPRGGFSSQSEYRNLYLQSDQLGNIVNSNSSYDCPKVLEGIQYSATTPSSVPSAAQGKAWPLDTSFALSSNYSNEWSVGVSGPSVLQSSSSQTGTVCSNNSDSSTTPYQERGIVHQCLGYAKKPNTDGTCGSMVDSNGKTRPMTRLRRYRVIYPTSYQTTGAVDTIPIEADLVYVADRLVVTAQGVPTGDLIYGPKPCNFAWFDHEGVVNRNTLPNTVAYSFGTNVVGDTVAGTTYNALPSYVATSQFTYSGSQGAWPVNPDGIFLPNMDRSSGVDTYGNTVLNSCSAAIAKIETTAGSPSSLRLITTNAARADYLTLGTRKVYLAEVQIKPVDPWFPNYVEDLNFQACVPLADPFLEPPMHIYQKDANTMGWCTKSYPSQNPYWVSLNSKARPSGSVSNMVVNYPGAVAVPLSTPYAQVQIYTSHNNTSVAGANHYLDALNNCSSTDGTQICTMTGGDAFCPTYLLPANGTTRKTCDRTVSYDPTSSFHNFPLQAQDTDIASMLSADLGTNKIYSCQYSVSSNTSKVGKKIPSSGCCGVVNGSPLLAPIINQVNQFGTAADGHLEPYQNAAFPTVRFCGSPVQ